MKPLIIYAHPNIESHSSHFLREVELQLKKEKMSYDLIDLYKIQYDPVLHLDELYTSRGKSIAKQNKKFQQMISKSNKLIFIYPIWWNTMPAIMKGFLDKIFTPHFAFEFKKYWFCPITVPCKLLKGKKAIVFLSSGTNKWLSLVFQGWRARTIIRKDSLGFFGIQARTYQLGDATRLTENHIKKIGTLVTKGLRWLL